MISKLLPTTIDLTVYCLEQWGTNTEMRNYLRRHSQDRPRIERSRLDQD